MKLPDMRLVHSPESMIEIITPLNRLIDERESIECRRILPRRRLLVPIRVQLLDSEMQPAGQLMEGVSQDITMGGLGFLCPCEVNAPFALVQFYEQLEDHHPLLVEIKHTRQMGPFWLVGGSFRADWS